MVHRPVDPRPRNPPTSTPTTHPSNEVLGAPLLSAPTSRLADERTYPDKLDPRLLRIAGVCVLAAVMTHLDFAVVSVAQRTLVAEFGSTQAVVAWTMTGYMLGAAAVIPLTGWAADRFGIKRPFMGSVAAFTVGSLLCAMAPNILLLIVFRVIQGLGGGMLMPLVYTIFTREAGPKRLGRLMAALGIPMVVGPILGGWLIDTYSWEWIFRVNVPIGVITLVLAAIVFDKDRATPSEAFDVVGVLLLSPGMATFLYGVSSIPGRGTVADCHVLLPAAIGLALIAGFVFHALHRVDHPLIDLRLFTNRVVTLANAAMFFFAAAFFGAELLVPSYLQQLLHQTPLQSGVLLIPRGLGGLLIMPLAGAVMDKRGPGKVVLVGITGTAAGMAIFAYGVWHQADYQPILLAGLAIMGMGMGCTVMPLLGSAVLTLAPRQIARGSTLISVNEWVAGSIGAALTSVILTNQFNRSENIAAADKFAILQENAAKHGVPLDPSAIPRQALAPSFMTNVLHDQAHAYTAVFVFAAILMALTYIPAALLPKKPTEAN